MPIPTPCFSTDGLIVARGAMGVRNVRRKHFLTRLRATSFGPNRAEAPRCCEAPAFGSVSARSNAIASCRRRLVAQTSTLTRPLSPSSRRNICSACAHRARRCKIQRSSAHSGGDGCGTGRRQQQQQQCAIRQLSITGVTPGGGGERKKMRVRRAAFAECTRVSMHAERY